jgi:hypothetical protein
MSAGDVRLPAEQPERRPPRPHTRRFPAREENGQGDGNEDSLGPVEDEDARTQPPKVTHARSVGELVFMTGLNEPAGR